MDVASSVEAILIYYENVIFSKSFCSYCKDAKSIFAKHNITPFVVELDEIESGNEIQQYLQMKTSQATVPNIWLHHKFIGGDSELQKLDQANLI